jgi:hypothetical protein
MIKHGIHLRQAIDNRMYKSYCTKLFLQNVSCKRRLLICKEYYLMSFSRREWR